jgi:hypothetical protein
VAAMPRQRRADQPVARTQSQELYYLHPVVIRGTCVAVNIGFISEPLCYSHASKQSKAKAYQSIGQLRLNGYNKTLKVTCGYF